MEFLALHMVVVISSNFEGKSLASLVHYFWSANNSTLNIELCINLILLHLQYLNCVGILGSGSQLERSRYFHIFGILKYLSYFILISLNTVILKGIITDQPCLDRFPPQLKFEV